MFAELADADVEPVECSRIETIERFPCFGDVAADNKFIGFFTFTEKAEKMEQVMTVFGQYIVNKRMFPAQLQQFPEAGYLLAVIGCAPDKPAGYQVLLHVAVEVRRFPKVGIPDR